MVPTTLTSEKEDLLQTLACYEQARQHNTKGAYLLGMHLEGPYFALNQRGAQDPRYIRNPDPEEYKEVLARSSSICGGVPHLNSQEPLNLENTSVPKEYWLL
jgi:N-acetylglucosamine-6-phosphate deacetylase